MSCPFVNFSKLIKLPFSLNSIFTVKWTRAWRKIIWKLFCVNRMHVLLYIVLMAIQHHGHWRRDQYCEVISVVWTGIATGIGIDMLGESKPVNDVRKKRTIRFHFYYFLFSIDSKLIGLHFSIFPYFLRLEKKIPVEPVAGLASPNDVGTLLFSGYKLQPLCDGLHGECLALLL